MAKAVRKSSTSPHSDGLERPWPSSPGFPPNYVIRVKNLTTGAMYHANAYSCYAIRKIVDVLTENMGDEIETHSYLAGGAYVIGNLEIQSDQIKEILGYELTPAEIEWELPVNYSTFARNFVAGLHQLGSVSQSQSALAGTVEHEGVKSRFDVANPPPPPAKLKIGDKVTTEFGKPFKEAKIVAVGPKPKVSDDLGERVKALTDKPTGFDRAALQKFAEANGVWKTTDEKLANGLARMTVVNRLRGAVKKGCDVKWGAK